MSHSSEEENYWPGYVDALTSMVQVLAFVMMLLAMAVFVLSQNVAKGAVEAIARAAKIDVTPETGIAELTAKVVDMVAKASKAHPAAEEKAETPVQPAPGTASAGTEGSGDLERTAAATTPAGPGAQAPAQKIVNSALRQRPADPVDEEKRLVIPFGRGKFALDLDATAAIGAFVRDERLVEQQSRVVVRGYSSPSEGSISEARRLAYYRAVNLRRELLEKGLPSAAIQVRITDTSDADQGRTAELFVGGADAP